MNLPIKILQNTRVRENSTNAAHMQANNEGEASEKKKLPVPFPVSILSTKWTNDRILKNKGTISVQNMAKAVAAARA